MTTPSNAYVWIWLPEQTKPTVCGRLDLVDSEIRFIYGKSYLDNPNAIALDPRELPLTSGTFRPRIEMHGVLRDASPDAWGRQVTYYRWPNKSPTELDYLLAANYDRIGALDIQLDAQAYQSPLSEQATLEDLLRAAESIEQGAPLPKGLDAALLHGTSVGGARPKDLISDQQHQWIAKFSASSDQYPVVRCEFAAMWLAKKCKLRVADCQIKEVSGKDVLLVKRFDRTLKSNHWQRKFMISGLTALELHETEARLASYIDLAAFIRRYAKAPAQDNEELYRRMVFNILIGNTDDHVRNHAFFWDGNHYTLAPAYDICPMRRTDHDANQAMIVGKLGRASTLKNALSEANQFGLDETKANAIQKELIDYINHHWSEAAEYAKLTPLQSEQLLQATVLSPGCFYE